MGRRRQIYDDQYYESTSSSRSRQGQSGRSAVQRNGNNARMTGTRKRTLTLTNLLTALVGFVFIFCLSVTVTLNLRSIYYFNVRYQQLAYTTGYSEETIRANYDALIDYNLITKNIKELEFPDFPMSDTAAAHFAEVKQIFMAIQILCIFSGVLLLILLWGKIPRKDYGSLKLISIFAIIAPIIVGILALWNWYGFFIKFHELFFNNDYWIFNPVTDPVILILPDSFFACCAAAILLIMILGGLLCALIYRIATRRYRRMSRM